MRKFIFCSIVFFFCTSFFPGCLHKVSPKKDDATFELPSYVPGYYAIDPIVIGNEDNTPNDKNPDPDLSNLYNIGSKSTQFTLSGSGQITYLSSGLQAKSGKYNVILDHLVYSPMELILEFKEEDNTKANIPIGLVLGVSIRIKGKATANEGSFNLSDIPGLGASSAVSAVGANVEIEVIGIRNSTILKLPRYIGDLNANTLQTLIQNIATINAEIDGDNTEIVPQIIGVDIKSLPEDIELHDVVAALRKWKADQVKGGKSIKINALSGDVQTFTYEWQRSTEFLEKKRQQRVYRLLYEIDNLPDEKAISLAISPPVQDSKINSIVNARDPLNKRTEDPNVAREILKMMATLGERNDDQLDAWEAAVAAIQ